MLFHTTSPTATPNSGSRAHQSLRRGALFGAVILALTAAVNSLAAQYVPAMEIRPMAGAYILTGDQRDFLDDSFMAGAQASWLATQRLAVTGSFGWMRPDESASTSLNRVNIMQYDAGLEGRLPSSVGEAWSFTPFVGLGAGARTYDYSDISADSKTFFSGYAGLGGELAYRSVGLRLEGRNYISRFEPLLTTGERTTRNDVTLSAALNLRIW